MKKEKTVDFQDIELIDKDYQILKDIVKNYFGKNKEPEDLFKTNLKSDSESPYLFIGYDNKIHDFNSWGRYFDRFPEEIGKLDELNRLQLCNENLGKIPSSIGNLKNLTHLRTSNSSVKKLPREIGNLENATLLALDENKIENLPKEINNLGENLKYFNISRNKLDWKDKTNDYVISCFNKSNMFIETDNAYNQKTINDNSRQPYIGFDFDGLYS